MNDRLAEGLQRQTSMTDYCGEGKLFERIFRGNFKEVFKNEERTVIKSKRKILEFCPPVVRHAVCCNPGALGRSSIPSCDAAVFSTSHPLSRDLSDVHPKVWGVGGGMQTKTISATANTNYGTPIIWGWFQQHEKEGWIYNNPNKMYF